MSTNVIQTSFAAGELSPTLNARVDIAKYHVGASLMYNFFVDYRGGASTRPGTMFVARAPEDDSTVWLIPFQFSTIQNYVLVFSNEKIRVVKDGAYVTETPINLDDITQANPGQFTTTAPHGFSNGNWVYLQDIGGMTELNQTFGIVQNATADTFTLLDLDGNQINTTDFTAYTSGGTVSRVYEIASPYLAADIPNLKYTQSADTMTITHVDYAPRELTRTGHTSWTLTTITFASAQAAPVLTSVTASSAGAAVYAYAVTAVNAQGEESVASNRGDETGAVLISSTAGFIAIAWNAAANAEFYRVYKALPLAVSGTIPADTQLGYIGDTKALTFNDTNIIADFTFTPPLGENPFADGNNPGAVAYFQQRLVLAASEDFPQTMWMSQTGLFHNFDKSNPVKPDDSITGTLVSKQVNTIKYMIDMPGGLVVLTSGGAWQINGGSAGTAVTPSAFVATPQAYNGCADVEPIVINDSILYVQDRGSIVRNLSYSFYTNIYTGADLSVLSNHFFFGYEVTQWAYAEEPFKIVWTVRNDGRLLSLTYLKEQEIFGWAQHQTLGLFKSVCTIPEGEEDATYFVTRRYIQGEWRQFIERMASRLFPYGVEDAWCVDCGLQLSQTFPAAGLIPSASTGTGVTFTADAAVFTSGDNGKVLRVGGGIATITSFTNTTTLVGTFTRDMTDVLDDGTPVPAESGEWTLDAKVDEVTGLEHLEGETVSILGDGNVFPQAVVTDGTVTLNEAASKIIVGLPFTARLRTMDLDVGEPTIQGKRKKVAALTSRVDQTRGLKVGPSFDELKEYKQRTTEPMGQPIALFTGDQRMQMTPNWSVPGRMCLEVSDPLPATVLGVIPEVVVGDTSK